MKPTSPAALAPLLKGDTPPAKPPSASTLAELVKRRSKPIVVPPAQDVDQINIDVAPSVNRIDVGRRPAARVARLAVDSDSNVQAAQPVQVREPQQVKPAPEVAETKVFHPQATAPLPPPVRPLDGSPQSADDVQPPVPGRPSDLATAGPVTATGRVADGDSAEIVSEPDDSSVDLAGESSAAAESKPLETELAQSETASGDPESQDHPLPQTSNQQEMTSAPSDPLALRSAPAAGVATEGGQPSPAAAASPPVGRSPHLVQDNSFGLPPLKSFEPETAIRLQNEASATTTIHVTRLRELAQQSLRNAKHRLDRRATHSAKKYALEALRCIVAMRDAAQGGNQHAAQLEMALDAIRESGDFCGRYGTVDQDALKRLVAVHETDALKNADLDHVSALEATEAYLADAKQNLIQAGGDIREASDALVLLGRIEKEMAPSDTHASAVALTLQRAAIAIVPASAFGYRELGTTLMAQGLVEQAAMALHRSIEIQPTRAGYQRLLEASRRLGDVDTARVCLASLRKPAFQSNIPVQTLTPQEFAAMHRPRAADMRPVNAPPDAQSAAKATTVKQQRSSESKISLRSLFFGRR